MTRILDAIHLVLKVVLGLLIAGLLVPVTMQVISRFTGLIPRYIWTEEIARFCFIWMIMVGAICAVRSGTHFDLDVMPPSIDPRVEAAKRIFVDLMIAALYALVLGMIVYRSIGLNKLAGVFYDTGRFASIALFCIGTASAFGWLLAYFKIPAALVAYVQAMNLGVTEMGIAVAISFLVIGCFIDAIPAIIILGTVLWPVTQSVGMHPIHFAIIGVISLAFGLVTPPYGLCLLISCAIGQISVKQALRDVAMILAPMLGILLLVIVFPEITLWLPRLLMPKFVN
ncbi:MAG: TRAP transporter large permease subunit [Bauldia sp.]|nr:MAG: TRAP transporter large permease subunit [Bauldia sp.]